MARNRKHQKAHRVTAEGFAPVANPVRARADAERARSNAAGTHADRRTRRNRTRAAQHARAIREYA